MSCKSSSWASFSDQLCPTFGLADIRNKNERDHIEMYVTYWRQRRGGSLCMGRPEAQIVLLSLRDFVQTYHATFDMRIHPSHMKQSPPHQ